MRKKYNTNLQTAQKNEDDAQSQSSFVNAKTSKLQFDFQNGGFAFQNIED
jgi:hypothetical protein